MIESLNKKKKRYDLPHYKIGSSTATDLNALRSIITEIKNDARDQKVTYAGYIPDENGKPIPFIVLHNRIDMNQMPNSFYNPPYLYVYEDEDGTVHEFLGIYMDWFVDGIKVNNFPTRYKTLAQVDFREFSGGIWITYPDSNWNDYIVETSDGTSFTKNSLNYNTLSVTPMTKGAMAIDKPAEATLADLSNVIPELENKVNLLSSQAANLYVSR